MLSTNFAPHTVYDFKVYTCSKSAALYSDVKEKKVPFEVPFKVSYSFCSLTPSHLLLIMDLILHSEFRNAIQ